MIDTENIVFSNVATALRDTFKPPLTGKLINVSGDLAAVPSSFPSVLGAEMDNSVYERTMSSSSAENHATVMWQWEAVSDKAGTKKTECKAIMAMIDAQMTALGFVRVGCSPIPLPSLDPAKYYRMIARYRGVVSAGVVSGGDTIFHVYGR